MGARPTALVVAIAAPAGSPVSLLEGIADGLRDACESLAPGCGIVGGDLSVSATFTIAVTAFGDLEGREPVLRSGAQPGDIVAVVGLIDDRYGLPAWVKLGGQFAGFLILAYFGVRVRLPIPELLNYALTFFWLAGISNAINFLDNMDGLSAGVSAVAAAFMLLLGALNTQFLVSALAAAVLGACLGFLRYNFKPAQIFMGDVGALFLGFVLAILGLQLRFPENQNVVTWMIPIMILGLPILDTTLVVISRIRRGVSPNTAGKDHISHRLVMMGFSQREAVLILYLATGVFGLIGVFLTRATVLEGYLIGGLVALAALYAIYRLERVYRG